MAQGTFTYPTVPVRQNYFYENIMIIEEDHNNEPEEDTLIRIRDHDRQKLAHQLRNIEDKQIWLDRLQDNLAMQVWFSSLEGLDDSEWKHAYQQLFRDELYLQYYDIKDQEEIVEDIWKLFDEPFENIIEVLWRLFEDPFEIIYQNNQIIFYEGITPIEEDAQPNPNQAWEIAARDYNIQLL